MAGGHGIYGGDTSLEARVDSLESGDAWSNKTTGFVATVQGDGSIAWEAASGGGSLDPADDITLTGNAAVDFQGDIGADSGAHTRIRWDDTNYGLAVVGPDAQQYTDFYVESPLDPAKNIDLSVSDAASYIQLQHGAGVYARMTLIANRRLLCDTEIELGTGQGVIMQSPDTSLHRLLVADDGTLSTEPVA